MTQSLPQQGAKLVEEQSEQTPESQEEPVLSGRTTGRRIKDIDALSEEELERLTRRNKSPQRLREITEVMEELIAIKAENGGTLRGTGARKAAAIQLHVTVDTIDNYLERYEADPCVESLADEKRGRTPGGTFTKRQQEILAYYYKNPEKRVIDDDQNKSTLKGLEDVAFMQKALQRFSPDPPHSDDAVRRFLRLLKFDDALAVTLAHKGETYLRNKILPARRNDPELANDRWQIDGRPLPIYIRHDGLVCTVTLLLIIDDLSQYPLRARLIPRKMRDEKGLPKNCDFTAADVGIVFASAIHYSGVCPGALYNDNGSQLVAMEDFLNDLSEENEAVVRMSKSIPRRPRGRGKIENMLKVFDEMLKEQEGNLVGKEGNFEAIREARANPKLLSLEKLQEKCDKFINVLRNRPRRQGEKKTRAELWLDPNGIRKAPPIRRLMTMVPRKVSRDTAIDYWHFQFDSQEYEPRLKSEEDLYRWMVAAARKEFVPLRAAELDAGWECDICLDRHDAYWCEGVLKTERYLSKDDYPAMLGRVLTRAKREHADVVNVLRDALSSIKIDQVYKHDMTKEVVELEPGLEKGKQPRQDEALPPPSGDAPANAPTGEQPRQDEAPPPPSGDAPANAPAAEPPPSRSVSVRTAPPRTPQAPAGRKFEWSKAPKAKETLEKIEREMQKDQPE
jgi:hypothetical protein